jgi:hypothetical protein
VVLIFCHALHLLSPGIIVVDFVGTVPKVSPQHIVKVVGPLKFLIFFSKNLIWSFLLIQRKVYIKRRGDIGTAIITGLLFEVAVIEVFGGVGQLNQ